MEASSERDPVAFHQREIAAVERPVEFAERAERFARIDLAPRVRSTSNDVGCDRRIHAMAPNAA